MKPTLYGIKNCDTCRKARRWLDELAIDYLFHDLREDGLSETLLDQLIQNVSWETLLNTRSTTWRQLSDSDKVSLDQARAKTLMLAHPTLIKRPVLVTDLGTAVGFDQARYSELLSDNR